MAVALLLAAGKGERLGSQEAKAFVLLGGRSMVEWSVEALRAVAAVERIVVALPEGAQAPAGTIGVVGGASRSASVRAALAAAAGDPVIVHDAARPLAGTDLFERALAELKATGADGVVVAVPVSDTIKRADLEGRVIETPDRSALWAIQTPQVFRRAALEAALADEEAMAAATDDASLVEAKGGDVRVVAGSVENIKVTTSVDLRVATQLLARQPGVIPSLPEPLQIVQGFVDAISARDFRTARRLLSSDVRWEHTEDPLGGEMVMEGPDAVIEFMEKLHHVWDDFRASASRYEQVGNAVICDTEVRGRGRRSGASVHLHHTELWTLNGGLIVRRQAFEHRGEALWAAGVG